MALQRDIRDQRPQDETLIWFVWERVFMKESKCLHSAWMSLDWTSRENDPISQQTLPRFGCLADQTAAHSFRHSGRSRGIHVTEPNSVHTCLRSASYHCIALQCQSCAVMLSKSYFSGYLLCKCGQLQSANVVSCQSIMDNCYEWHKVQSGC